MRETIRSMSVYLVLVGLLGLASDVFELSQSRGNPQALLVLLPGMGIAGAYFYFGVRLRSLLTSSPRLVLGGLKAGMAYLALMFVLCAISDPNGCIQVGIGLLIAWYLWVNAKRLSSELRGQPAQTEERAA